MEVNKIYVSGLGKISFGVIKDVTETPGLIISDLIIKNKKINSDCEPKNCHNETIIAFKNLEGLKVLENAIKKIKKILKEQEQWK